MSLRFEYGVWSPSEGRFIHGPVTPREATWARLEFIRRGVVDAEVRIWPEEES